VAFFPDLCHFHKDIIPETQAPAQGQLSEIDPLGSNVLGEVAWPYFETSPHHLVDALLCQEAYLTMPFARMGVLFDPVIGSQDGSGHVVLSDPFGLAHRDGMDTLSDPFGLAHRDGMDTHFFKYPSSLRLF
jgi:hypothetical protein